MLELAHDLSLPFDTLTSRQAVVGISGSGKTYTLSVLAEEMLKAGGHVAVIDPLGVAWGLRALPGNAEDIPLPLYILGGDKADLPLDPGAGAAIAEIVVQERLSVVLDLSHFDDDTQRAVFVAAFAARLLMINREPLHVFVDEADLFAPQTPSTKEEFTCRKAMDNLVRRGRVKGVGVTLVTQRPAVVAKNLLTQITTLVAHQLTGQSDRQAVDAWIKANGGDEQRKAVLDSLASLTPGEAWVWKPGADGVFARVRIRMRHTFDSSATPVFGKTLIEPKRLDAPDLSALRKKLAALFEAVVSDDPDVLKEQIADLKRQLTERPKETVTVEKVVEKIVEVPVLTPDALARMRDMLDAASGIGKDLAAFHSNLKGLLERFDTPAKSPPVVAAAPSEPAAPTVESVPKAKRPKKIQAPAKVVLVQEHTTATSEAISMSGPQQKILNALARLEGFGIPNAARGNVAVFADTTASSSGFRSNLSALRTKGLLDYATGGTVYLTEAGRVKAASVEPLTTPEQLLHGWVKALSGPQGRILSTLFECYPKSLSRETLAQRTDSTATSSGFRSNLSALRTLGLIDYKEAGQVVATALLFPA